MRARSVVSRMLFLHVVTICVAAILMPLALYEMLKAAADDLHHRALAEQADEIAQYIKSLPDGTLVLDLPPRIRMLYSSSYGRYEFAVLDAAGQVVSSSLENNAPVAAAVKPQLQPVFFESKRPKMFEHQSGESVIWGGSFPEEVSDRKVW